jgi:hypothetical protein
MRKLLILGLLAATAAVPSNAMAQDLEAQPEISREERREARQERRPGTPGGKGAAAACL